MTNDKGRIKVSKHVTVITINLFINVAQETTVKQEDLVNYCSGHYSVRQVYVVTNKEKPKTSMKENFPG